MRSVESDTGQASQTGKVGMSEGVTEGSHIQSALKASVSEDPKWWNEWKPSPWETQKVI